jgi:hypothetical protein
VSDDLVRLGQVAGALIAIATLLGMFIKWVIVKPIKLYIDQATYQIQPDTNGGKSLSDLHAHVAQVRDLILEHLESHKGNTPPF